MDLNEGQSLYLCLCLSLKQEIKGGDQSIVEVGTFLLILCQGLIL